MSRHGKKRFKPHSHRVGYFRRRTDLGTPTNGDRLVVLAAAKIGSTRLIDNLELDVAV
jgi:pantothenate synthetase